MLIEVEQLTKSYGHGPAVLKGVSFTLRERQCVGLVGESGSGKSTLARCLLGLEPVDSGRIVMHGTELQNKSERALRPVRKNLQAVLQNPAAALNPKLKISDSLLDPYIQYGELKELKHFRYTGEKSFINQLMDAVELPMSLADRYPHELSGGQKQRVTIARAISIEPALIVLDEPTASLDVLSQAAILRLLDQFRLQLGTAYLFISHDLAAVEAISQKILVMKGGKLVDCFKKEHLFSAERHPYTKKLVSLFD